MKRSYRQIFSDIVIRFLTASDKKRTQQAAQCDENEKLAALSTMGEAQPVARLLENSEDISEVYSRPAACPICKGKGSRPAEAADEFVSANCEVCHGTGFKLSYEMPQRRGSAGRQCSEAPVTAQNSRDIPNAEQRISGRESGEGKVRVQGKVGNTALPTRLSEREKAGSRKEHSPQGRIPAPKKYRELLLVDTACETIFDSNRWGDQVCLREGVGICKFCGSIVCKPCVTFEFCPNAPCGQSRHLVIVQ